MWEDVLERKTKLKKVGRPQPNGRELRLNLRKMEPSCKQPSSFANYGEISTGKHRIHEGAPSGKSS